MQYGLQNIPAIESIRIGAHMAPALIFRVHAAGPELTRRAGQDGRSLPAPLSKTLIYLQRIVIDCTDLPADVALR